MNLPPTHPPIYPLRLSQGHLSLLETCLRKFQHLVLEQLGTPDAIEQQERLLQGARFHLLLQQWLMELLIEPMLQEDPQLHQWFESFKQAAPKILDEGMRQAESDRILEFVGYLLNVRYDLLILSDHHAKILDWKTYPRPQQSKRLEQHWQTRLYLFVLAETSDYLPEQLSLVYWFFQAGQAGITPQSLTFPYNSSKHEQTRQDLTLLLDQLTVWLTNYQTGEPLPQVKWGFSHCEVCSFAPRCDRVFTSVTASSADENEVGDQLLQLPTLIEIEEVPL